MAVAIHVVHVGVFTTVNGSVVNKNDATINQMMRADTEHRVIPDASIPSSANYPTVKAYLEAEASAGFKLSHMTQSMIVTYPA